MNFLKNNLTFVVIITDASWRTDLTIRFCEYFSYKINDVSNFNKRIIIVESIDEALNKCETDYLLIQEGGHVTFQKSFFEILDQCAAEKSDIILGHLVLANDYVQLDPRCLFVNMILWNENEKPLFKSNVKDGPQAGVTVISENTSRPSQIKKIEGDRTFVTGACGHLGAALIIKQLDTYGQSTSLAGVMGNELSHFLDTTSALSEIHSETLFEKLFQPLIKNDIFTIDSDDMSNVGTAIVDIVIAPAQGLKALTLAEHFKATKIIVYDNNPIALELQRKIFNRKIATTYGEIISEFIQEFPNSLIVDNWENDKYAIIKPLSSNISVEFKNIDMFSFQIEDIIKTTNHTNSLVIDFSDIFIYPYNYYRRPLYQVQGLFAEVYSLLKSRAAPTYILGFAPGFQRMDTIEVNTSTIQFTMDPSLDPFIERKKALEESNMIEEDSIDINPVFAPQTSIKEIQEDTWKPPLTVDEQILPPIKNPIASALDLGYTKNYKPETISGKLTNLTVLSKIEIFEEFTAVFEYIIDELAGTWSFKVGTPTDQKRVEFSNGLSIESFKKHLFNVNKINPKTTCKYFQ